MLIAGGSLLGLAFAEWAMQLLARLIPAEMLAEMPYLQGFGINLHVLSFAGAIALLAAALFSITPALRMVMTEMRDGLAEGGRGSAGTLWRRFGANLVVVELAIAVVLLAGAGCSARASTVCSTSISGSSRTTWRPCRSQRRIPHIRKTTRQLLSPGKW